MFLHPNFLFPAQVFCRTSLLVQDLWSSPPVVALACLHILPYLHILQDQRLLLFWIFPEAEQCCFFVLFFFSTEQECLASSNCRCSSSVLEDIAADCCWVSSWSEMHLFLGDGISEFCYYPPLLFSPPPHHLLFSHSGCNHNNVWFSLRANALTAIFKHLRNTDRAIETLSGNHLHYL